MKRNNLFGGLAGIVLAGAVGCSDSEKQQGEIIGRVHNRVAAYEDSKDGGIAFFSPAEEPYSVFVKKFGEKREEFFDIPKGYMPMKLVAGEKFAACFLMPSHPHNLPLKLLIQEYDIDGGLKKSGEQTNVDVPVKINSALLTAIEGESLYFHQWGGKSFEYNIKDRTFQEGSFSKWDSEDYEGRNGKIEYDKKGIWYLRKKSE